MKIEPENLLNHLELEGSPLVRMRHVVPFWLASPPEKSDYCYPIVDRTLGIGIFLDGAHEVFTSRLGQLHAKKDIRLSPDDEDIESFLRNHGYYWSSLYSRLVTAKNFQFNKLDHDLSLRWRLSMLNKDYPFD